MKKFILALSVFMAMLFTGCSCVSATQLSFAPNWKKSETASAGYSYTTVYDVGLNKSFILGDNDYSTTSIVNDVFEDYNFVGTYTETVSIIEVNDYNKDASNVLEDSKNATLLKITSLLSINATYKLLGEEAKTYNDFVKTESYILDTDNSLAPIYTESENNYTIINLERENPVQTLHFKTTTLYQKEQFTCKQQEFNYGEDCATSTCLNENIYTCAYSYKCLIDNSTLLFALRNLNHNKEKTISLPVVSPAYKNGINLSVVYTDDVKTKDANDTEFDTKIVQFVSSDTSKMGLSQFVYIQNTEVAGKNNSLIVKYFSPLSEYSSQYARLGVLEYTIRNY